MYMAYMSYKWPQYYLYFNIYAWNLFGDLYFGASTRCKFPIPNVLDFQNFSPKSLLPVVKGAPAVKTFTALWIPRPVSAVTGSVKASAGVACAAAAGAGAGALGALDAVGIAGAVTRRGERPRRPNCESGAMSGVNGVGILSTGWSCGYCW